MKIGGRTTATGGVGARGADERPLRRVLGALERVGRSRIFSGPTLGGVALLVAYAAILAGGFELSYLLRWDFDVPAEFAEQCRALLAPVIVCKLLLLASFGQFRSVLGYFSLYDFGCVLISSAAASISMLALWSTSEIGAAPPRGVILIDFVLSVGGLSALRLVMRLWHSRVRQWAPAGSRFRGRIAIIGAGDTGSSLAQDLITKRSFGLQPVVFLDDDKHKWGRRLHGLPIIGPIERLPEVARKARVAEVILTLPGSGPKKVKEVLGLVRRAGLKASIVPSFTQMAAGDVQVQRFRPVELEDLLGREQANLDSASIDRSLQGETVLVTGAGGSIGSELCRQIAARRPARLLLLDQSEVQLFQIEQELIGRGCEEIATALVADVLDSARLHEIFLAYRPSIVFHAAAHKHVFMMERQPAEAVKNNFLGTARLARAAREFGTRRFVLISTDKAINPTSVMGASKRLAEYAILAEQQRDGSKTMFMAVRFGNVLGSSGSVIPIFKRQIAAGGPVTVTHPDVTRYFMTIPEAVGLVLQAAAIGTGGEVFVLDMGTPLKIIDVARQLIELSGFRPDIDIEVKIIGLRPGEKLYEELQHVGENHAATVHPRILRLVGPPPAPAIVDACLGELVGAAHAVGGDELKLAIKKWVTEYTPCLGGVARTAAETVNPAGGSAGTGVSSQGNLGGPVAEAVRVVVVGRGEPKVRRASAVASDASAPTPSPRAVASGKS